MFSYWIINLSFIVGISAIIGLVRIKKIQQANYPFIVFLWIGFLNEIISEISIFKFHTNAPNSNLYVLLSTLVLIWQFKTWKLFDKQKKVFYLLLYFVLISWVIENLLISSIFFFNSYTAVIYSFLIVMLSIHMISRLIFIKMEVLPKSSTFLICFSFILMYTVRMLVEIFWIYGLDSSKSFQIHEYLLISYVNLIVNIINIIAVLWIPGKREFILH